MSKKNVLVTGGAGYIGSHAVKKLIENGDNPVILDNFSTGNKWALQDCEFFDCDLLDNNKLKGIFATNSFDYVMHFAGKSLVGESVKKPSLYYENNVSGSINLFNACIDSDIDKIIFSSSAAVYGDPKTELINENHQTNPKNPYGQSKLFVEKVLEDAFIAYGLSSISFRYFNAAGADPLGAIGEFHEPETHLIPNVIMKLISEKNSEKLKIFGDKYQTKDGTCVRDYIHVNDIASAHIKAFDFLDKNSKSHIFNLGNGSGFSVLEVINTVKDKLNLNKISYEISPPRDGDPAVLVADSAKANSLLNWHPNNSNIENIINDAINWHRSNNL